MNLRSKLPKYEDFQFQTKYQVTKIARTQLTTVKVDYQSLPPKCKIMTLMQSNKETQLLDKQVVSRKQGPMIYKIDRLVTSIYLPFQSARYHICLRQSIKVIYLISSKTRSCLQGQIEKKVPRLVPKKNSKQSRSRVIYCKLMKVRTTSIQVKGCCLIEQRQI